MAEFITGESDPADFTVAEVTAHLATASDDEVARVQDLESPESGGKDRVGILEYDPEPAREAAHQEFLEAEGAVFPAPGTRLPDTEDGYGRVVVDAYPAPADA